MLRAAQLSCLLDGTPILNFFHENICDYIFKQLKNVIVNWHFVKNFDFRLKINLEHIKTNFVGKKIKIRVASDEPVKFTNSSDVFTNFFFTNFS